MEIFKQKIILEKNQDLPKIKVDSSHKAYELFNSILFMSNEPQEILSVITLNPKGYLTGIFEVSRGGVCKQSVSMIDIIRPCILTNSVAFILAHNHPSGDTTPSIQDIIWTKKIKSLTKELGLAMIDHIIIGDESYERIEID